MLIYFRLFGLILHEIIHVHYFHKLLFLFIFVPTIFPYNKNRQNI